MKITKSIDTMWSEYDKVIGECQLSNYGVIFIDEYGCPIDDEYGTDELYELYKTIA